MGYGRQSLSFTVCAKTQLTHNLKKKLIAINAIKTTAKVFSKHELHAGHRK